MEISEEQFGIEVLNLLKERKLTQRSLAEHLKLTPASVSYILQNKIRPSAAHFDGIMEFLKVDAPQINRLRKYWLATQKETPEHISERENLFAVRLAAGATVEEVSANTGIPPERLRILENKANAVPTPKEMELLKEFYGNAPQGMEGLSDGENPPASGVAEEFLSELDRCEKTLPVFSMDVLLRASKAGSLEKFLGGLSFNDAVFSISSRYLQQAKAVLICNSEDIHFGFKGVLELVLADYDPESIEPLHLGKGNRGGFALWQKMRRSWKYFGAEHPAPRMSNNWSLPVLEMHFVAAPCRQDTAEKNK